MIMTTEHTRCD